MCVNEINRLTRAIQGKTNGLILAEGLNRLLKNVVRQNKTTLPYSYYQINFDEELMMFLWRVFSFNQSLLKEILTIRFGRDNCFSLTEALTQYFLIRIDHFAN
mmetsp:Transcript_28479/g.27452  ORF Transcript_28479/g.27452 Transcript_28479/m.27452 type:complete len:103 (-) Transcript_28479:762-1070(-)